MSLKGARELVAVAVAQGAADKILAVDGCPLDCVKHCLEQAGFTKLEHLQLAEFGFEKGKSPVSKDAVAKAAAKGKEMLAGRRYS